MAYSFIIILPTFFYILEHLIKTKNNLFEKIGISFLVLFTSMRIGPGADYQNYLNYFNRSTTGFNTDRFEFGFTILNKIIAQLGLSFHVLLFVIALFNGVMLYKAINENVTKYKWFAIFFYLIYFDLFIYSLSAIRQSIVVSIMLYSIRYIYRNQKLKYFTWTLIGTLFHWSGLILIPVLYIYRYLLNKNSYAIAGQFLSLFIIGYVVLGRFIHLLRPYMNYNLQYYIFIQETDTQSSIVGAGITLILLLAWVLYIYKFLYNRETITSKEVKVGICIDIPLLATTLFLALKVMQYLIYYSFIPRIQLYFYCFLPFAAANIVNKFNPHVRMLVMSSMIVLLIILFYYKYNSNIIYYKDFRILFF